MLKPEQQKFIEDVCELMLSGHFSSVKNDGGVIVIENEALKKTERFLYPEDLVAFLIGGEVDY